MDQKNSAALKHEIKPEPTKQPNGVPSFNWLSLAVLRFEHVHTAHVSALRLEVVPLFVASFLVCVRHREGHPCTCSEVDKYMNNREDMEKRLG